MIKIKASVKKNLKKIVCIFLAVVLVGCISLFGINAYVKGSVDSLIISPEEAVELSDVDCILVLGCLVRNNTTPSHMLADRLRRSVELYDLSVSPKLLMSGDHGQKDYDEVSVMKKYALDEGVPSEDVFMDHAGFSTYESVYRAKEIFCADKIVIVSQGYHLYRALYVAKALGIEAYGVSADYRTYSGQFSRDVREILARVKDFFMCIVKPEPTYLGEAVPVSGNGDVTNS